MEYSISQENSCGLENCAGEKEWNICIQFPTHTISVSGLCEACNLHSSKFVMQDLNGSLFFEKKLSLFQFEALHPLFFCLSQRNHSEKQKDTTLKLQNVCQPFQCICGQKSTTPCIIASLSWVFTRNLHLIAPKTMVCESCFTRAELAFSLNQEIFLVYQMMTEYLYYELVDIVMQYLMDETNLDQIAKAGCLQVVGKWTSKNLVATTDGSCLNVLIAAGRTKNPKWIQKIQLDYNSFLRLLFPIIARQTFHLELKEQALLISDRHQEKLFEDQFFVYGCVFWLQYHGLTFLYDMSVWHPSVLDITSVLLGQFQAHQERLQEIKDFLLEPCHLNSFVLKWIKSFIDVSLHTKKQSQCLS